MSRKFKRTGTFHVYILRCKDGTYYTGYTPDLERRVETHNKGRGAKYTACRRPVELVWSKEFKYFKLAYRAEREVKKLDRKRKEKLIAAYRPLCMLLVLFCAWLAPCGAQEKDDVCPLMEEFTPGGIPTPGQEPRDLVRLQDISPYELHIFQHPLALIGGRVKKGQVIPLAFPQTTPSVGQESSLSFTRPLFTRPRFNLPEDKLMDFAFQRQFVKRYAEGELAPVLYNGTVLMRNHWRLFCVDGATGSVLWSHAGKDGEELEHCQTFRPPHTNTHGYQMLVQGERVYTGLGGKLVCLTVGRESCKSEWELDLGEYFLCTQPLRAGDTLVIGLANARGEIWLCGVDPASGKLEWSSFIGRSSFLSPPCGLALSSDKQAFVATNHGVLACVDPSSGKVLWLHTYAPRVYRILDLWFNGKFRASSRDVPNVEYDTQFLEEDAERLYYKPRESRSFYILDKTTGKCLKEVRLAGKEAPYRSFVLRICGGKAVYLEKENGAKWRLDVCDIDSGKPVKRFTLNGGELNGVVSAGNPIFKTGDRVHFLKQGPDGFSLEETEAPAEGWLTGVYGESLMLCHGRQVSVLGPDTQIKESFVPQETPPGLEFYRSGRMPGKQPLRAGKKAGFELDSERLFLLPVKVMREPLPEGVFFCLNTDQLLCVDTAGTVLWQRPLLYYSLDATGRTLRTVENEKSRGYLFEDEIDGWLYDRVLIVNDGVNLVALDIADGSCIWSVSNDSRVLRDELSRPEPDPETYLAEHGASGGFLKDIRLNVAWIGDRMYLIHGTTIRRIDPGNGEITAERDLDMPFALQTAAHDGKLYVLSGARDSVAVLDSDLKPVAKYSVGKFKDPSAWPELGFCANNAVLHAGPELYLLGPDGNRGDRLEDETLAGARLLNSDDRLIALWPLKKAAGYSVNTGKLNKVWETALVPEGAPAAWLWQCAGKRTQWYYLSGKKMLTPVQDAQGFALACIDTRSGKVLWRQPLGLRGYWSNLSEPVFQGKTISFIASVCAPDPVAQARGIPPSSAITSSVLFEAGLENGALRSRRELRTMQTVNWDLLDKTQLVSTGRGIAFTVGGKKLTVGRGER